MLNRSTQIDNPENTSIDITGYATWRCPRGHITQVWLKFNGSSAYGGSAWDFCDDCSQHPNVLQDTKSHLQIFSKWLDEGNITLSQYRMLAKGVVNTLFSPAIEANPIGFLGLPTWQQLQNQATFPTT